EAAFEWQQIARPAHRAFRKDADDVTLLELVPGAFEGLDDLAPPASNRNRVHPPEQPFEPGLLVVGAVDDEPDESLHARAHEQSVDVRHVVAHEERRAAERYVFLADDSDPVQRVRQEPETESDQEFWDEREDVHARHECEEAEDQDDAVRRESGGIATDPEGG